jgi:hypothetical protein
MKLWIGGPTRDIVPASFSVNLAELFAYTREFGPCGKHVKVDGFIEHTYIHCGRELVLEAALKQGFTHVLWLDTDMSFPRTSAVQLMAHDQPIVGCNYKSRRQGDSQWVARRHDGTRVETTTTSTGLEAVESTGFGVVLMRTDVVSGLGRPWFRHGLNDFGGDVGEDIMLCRGLGKAGYTVYIDHDLSKQVTHIGQYAYGISQDEPDAVHA